MSPSRRPEVFVSATSADLRTCRQLIKEALLTLGCMPVEQTNFPPDYRSVREMLRAKIEGCDAVVHLAGEVYGAEPKTRANDEPRRSYTQLEYDLARELKKPLYVFVCGEDFAYDEHPAEEADKQVLQQAHRAALSTGETLRYKVHSREDLALRIRELQTRVEHLGAELGRTRSWLGRGLAVGLLALALLGGGLWWVKRSSRQKEIELQSENETRRRENTASQAEIDRLRAQITAANQLTAQLSARMDQLAATAGEEKHDSLFAVQAKVAAERGITLDELHRQLAAEGADVRKIVATIEQRRRKMTTASVELAGLQREGLVKLGDTERVLGHTAEAVAAYDQAAALSDRTQNPVDWASVQLRLSQSLVDWADESDATTVKDRSVRAMAALRAALEVYSSEKYLVERAEAFNTIGILLLKSIPRTSGSISGRLSREAVITFRSALKVRTRDKFPHQWAITQSNLALALREQSILSPKPEAQLFLAEAVEACRQALEVNTREKYPTDWFRAKNSLAGVLLAQAENASGPESVRLIAESVDEFRTALSLEPNGQAPALRGKVQRNLGRALLGQSLLTSGPQSQKLVSEAEDFFHSALEVHHRESLPQDWADDQLILAAVAKIRARNSSGTEQIRWLEEAVKTYRSVLEVYTEAQFPQRWAYTQGSLAAVLSSHAGLTSGTQAARLYTEAIEAYRCTLQVHTQKESPLQWAETMTSVAKVCIDLANHGSSPYARNTIVTAVADCRSALQVYTQTDFPREWAETQIVLATALQIQAGMRTGSDQIQTLQTAAGSMRLGLAVFTAQSDAALRASCTAWLAQVEHQINTLSTTPEKTPLAPVTP